MQTAHPVPLVVKFALHIGRQACDSGIGVERSKKGFKIFRDHFIEHRIARIPGSRGLTVLGAFLG
jgi:hypothetical protein